MKSQSLFGNRVRAVVAKILESWMEVIIKYIVGDATLSIFFSKALTKVAKRGKKTCTWRKKRQQKVLTKLGLMRSTRQGERET